MNDLFIVRVTAQCLERGHRFSDTLNKHTRGDRIGHPLPLWRSVRWTVREERTSSTNGRDTTARFAGGE